MRTAWIALWLLMPASLPAQDGAAIYERGQGLTAHLGSLEGAELPAARVTCAGCHGRDGRGGSEGGAQAAPAIGWSLLSAPTPERPGYDAEALGRLLAQGVTPSGRVISGRMPRFRLAPEALPALIAHLSALDAQDRQGVGPQTIAVALPDAPEAAAAAQAAIAAFNAEGGAFGRLIVVGQPEFLALDDVIAMLVPRLRAAEAARLDQIWRENPALKPPVDPLPPEAPQKVAGTLDEIGPQLPQLLGANADVTVIGPSAEAMRWAIAAGSTGAGAHAYAAVRAALDLLRQQGRDLGRARYLRDLERLDYGGLVETYRQSQTRQP
ncbi:MULTISPECIES: cytochrome c [unclassified Paracoccus (in: a-proteobacteria)]|uniref:cytochrome c n=1 Tax=unclassified Paracoccus (in: a-proteobacteria) TaxID=2688777 RepID=UPI0021E0FEE8|nr:MULTISPECIES: cytochrome c [unclassified Paracoccus (in: a-proteobacteria)]UXU76527.1 cytochrome c [Paracoccus sp. SMMA_5]UXU82406.1 cytochrome c [Paracoccus sp. SMMA_5_TC]